MVLDRQCCLFEVAVGKSNKLNLKIKNEIKTLRKFL